MHTHVAEAGSGSRTAAEIAHELAKDPVCGMMVNKATALTSEHGGRTFYFCSPSCKATFDANPEAYT